MSLERKNPTALELLEDLLRGNSSTVIVSRAALQAIVKQLRKEQHLTLVNND